MEPKSAAPVRGTRDFGASQMRRRKALFSVIEAAFLRCGYGPLETPAMESGSTLSGKYGEEGDRLIFHVLNSGSFSEGIEPELWNQLREQPRRLVPLLCEKALRYDLTVPLARYVAANHAKLSFPFKRYQIQPVWRADRPQKGRFREFIQCDADVVAPEISTFHQAELLGLYRDVLDGLGFRNYRIRVNDRRFLNLLASWGGVPGQVARLGLLLDKLDKQGWAVVRDELLALGFEPSKLDRLVQSVPLDRPTGQVMTWIEFHDWMQAILRDGGITDLERDDALNALKETEQVVTFFGQNQGGWFQVQAGAIRSPLILAWLGVLITIPVWWLKWWPPNWVWVPWAVVGCTADLPRCLDTRNGRAWASALVLNACWREWTVWDCGMSHRFAEWISCVMLRILRWMLRLSPGF